MGCNNTLPILGNCQLLGVIGDPIKHSLSPVMHNAAIQAYAQSNGLTAIPYIYVPLHISLQDLPTAIAGLEAIHCRGFNITIPHKQAIMAHLDHITDVAQRIGAVNTVWRTERGWEGTNTDVFGFLAPLLDLQRDWSQGEAMILGNGGAARAVIAGCEQLGLKQIRIIGRDRQKLTALETAFRNPQKPEGLTIHTWEEVATFLPQTQLLINTTPIGMAPNTEATPITELDLSQLQPDAVVYDLIYTPKPTRFLAMADQQGHIIIDGLEMLVQQGAAALEIWLGSQPNVEIMRNAAQQVLGLK